MTRKFCSVFIALICGAVCAFSLVACNTSNKETHTTHNWSSTYTADGDRHYQTCDGCNEKLYSAHDYGTSGICICGVKKPAESHTHNYQWVDNGDGTHKQHCSVSGCDKPDINAGNHNYGTTGVCICGAKKPTESHTHDYQWVNNGDGTHKQHCSISSCDDPDINNGNHDYGTNGVCVCGAAKPVDGHTHNYQWVNNGDGTHKQHCSVSGCDAPDINPSNHNYGTNGVCVCDAVKPTESHGHNYQWVNNGDGTHKQHCSVSGCTVPDINIGSHNYVTTGVCICGAKKPADTQTQYNIIFNANGGKIDGNNTKTIIGTVNQTISRSNDPVRTGYTFTGWYKDGATTTLWNFDTDTVKGATTLYAGWEMNVTEYDVTFVLNYSGALNVIKSTENGLITYIPEHSGYIFNGWWYSDGEIDGNYILSEKFDTSKRVTQSGLTLYAEWVKERTDGSQLYSPSVSIFADGVFGWQAVQNAQSYRVEVYLGSSKIVEETLTATSWTFPNGTAAGYYTVKIRANGDGEITINSAYTEKYYAHHILGAVSGIEFNVSTSVLTWSAVNNATAYEVRVNNSLKATISYTTYDLSELDAGDYTVSVTAMREGYSSSTVKKTISKKRLTTPNVTVVENSSACTYTISWNAVAHSNIYRIKHHNTYINVTGTSYTISNDSPIYNSNGVGEFTVCAYDSNADYFISADSEVFAIEKIYFLTLNCSDNYAGTVSSVNQGYKSGERITVSASTNVGYTWVGWYNGTQKLTDELNYTFTMSRENVTYTAKWCKVTVVSEDTSAGTVSSLNSTYKVGDKATITASTNTGYTFVGWYNGTQKLTDNLSYTFNMPNENVTYTAKFEVNPLLAAFTFTVTQNKITITGVKDTSVTQLTVPTLVTAIAKGAFSGCSSLTSITMPFVGASINGTSNTYFGYIFGANYYSGNSSYVPASLKTVIISGGTCISSYAFYDCSSLTSITIPNGVTSIGEQAFYDCSALTSIEIPNSVTSIGYQAFSGCSSITSIEIPDSVMNIGERAFSGCSFLTGVTIGNGVTSIGSWAFYKCSILSIITIPNSIESIGEYTFGDCSGLKSITIGSSVTSIGSYAFYNCCSLTNIEIPDSVMSIESYAFSGCSSLTSILVNTNNPNYASQDGILYNRAKTEIILVPQSISGVVTIPISVTSIGQSAFSGCSGLTNIEIPASVTSIGQFAFFGCSSLTSITIPFVGARIDETSNAYFGYIFGAYSSNSNASYIPSTLKTIIITGGSSIGSYAFYGCSSFTSIEIPISVTSIGSYAFYNCSSLTSIEIPNVMSIGSYAFSGCSSITSITIPDGLISINDYTFSGCRGLTSIEIPTSVTSIGQSAFSGCRGLTSITIPFVGASRDGTSNTHFGYIFGASSYSYHSSYVPSSLKSVTVTGGTSIENQAFYNCSSLTSITIPDSVTSIGDDAFYLCDSLNYNKYDNAYYLGNTTNLYIVLVTATAKDITSCTINSATKFICASAFNGCSKLTNVTIPDGVISIGRSAFQNCDRLISITIPNSVVNVGSTLFWTSPYLVIYCVTKSQPSSWNEAWNSYNGGYPVIWNCNNNDKDTNGYSYYDNDGIRYRLENGTASVLCWIDSISEVLSIPSSITYNAVQYRVTSIEDYAFDGCSSLTSVTIPNSVTSIGNSAFAGCSSVTSIVIPDSVTSIGNSAFSGCIKITSITIPVSVSIIGSNVIYGCSNLATVTVASGNSKYYSSGNCIIETESQTLIAGCSKSIIPTDGRVTSIGNGAFRGCSGLTGITIPNSVTSIGDSAFAGCSGLMSITIPNAVVSIGAGAFSGCSGITSITIPGSATSIGSSAFSGCSGLTSVTIGDGITSIDYSWFYNGGIGTIKNITIPESVTSINNFGSLRLSNLIVYYKGDLASWLNKVAILNSGLATSWRLSINGTIIEGDLRIPDGVTTIKKNAFWCYTGLTSVTIPDSVTSLEGSAFSDCYTLQSVIIGNGVKSIKYATFWNCTGLTSVTIGSGVTSIESDAFQGCSSLSSAYFVNPDGWWFNYSSTATSGNSILSSYLSSPSTAATYLRSTYLKFYWKRGDV